MIRVADYIAKTLADYGVRHVFMVTGGGAMHLNDAIGKCKDLTYVCNHHEQASAMAAESYTRLSGKLAVVCVTTGPGGINALNGVFGAWVDSIPMLIVSGQVRYDTTVRSTSLNLRQLGDQECDITQIAAPICKMAVMVTDPRQIRHDLERALYLCWAGRPGPCWVDIPLNVQGSYIEETTLQPYDPTEDEGQVPPFISTQLVGELIERISNAERPVILAGSAVRSSGAYTDFLEAIDRMGIPVTTAWNAHDLLWDEHPLYCGRPGTVGDRAGNFAVQNADLLLVLGCRLNIRQIGYNWETFARAAFKIIVDIDPLELRKPTIHPDLPIHANVADFIRTLLRILPQRGMARSSWLEWCQERRRRYPVVLPDYWKQENRVNPYCFIDCLTSGLPEGQTIVTSNGTACVVTFQAANIKPRQRLYTNSGCASMGYELPAAIGASFASRGEKIVCIAGDGSIQMNLQELATIAYHHLPIKIFLLSNSGYHSIRQTQESFFGRPFIGTGPESGVGFPEVSGIAKAYGFPYRSCASHAEMAAAIDETMRGEEPAICEVFLNPDQPFTPKAASTRLPDGRIVSRPLEDLSPFLSREELWDNMLIPLLPE